MKGRFVVVGAGVFGAWVAYTLRQSGHAVTLLDAYGPGNTRASSGGETRIMRASYGADVIYTQMAQRSLDLWVSFFEAVGRPQLFLRTGALWITEPDDAHANASRIALRNTGVEFENLSANELRRRYPQINPPVGASAIFEKNAGALMARQAVQAVVQEFVRLGGEYRHAAVAAQGGASGKLAALRTVDGGTIPGDAFVFACGPWLRTVFAGLLGARMFITRQPVAYFGIPPGETGYLPQNLPVWLDFSSGRDMYGFPDIDSRGMKVASHTLGAQVDPDSLDRVVDASTVGEFRAYLALRFPGLAAAPVLALEVCQYENTANGDFILDRHPELENVWIAGGGSGHGFKHGPAVGEYVSSLILRQGAQIEPRFSIAGKGNVQNRVVI